MCGGWRVSGDLVGVEQSRICSGASYSGIEGRGRVKQGDMGVEMGCERGIEVGEVM